MSTINANIIGHSHMEPVPFLSNFSMAFQDIGMSAEQSYVDQLGKIYQHSFNEADKSAHRGHGFRPPIVFDGLNGLMNAALWPKARVVPQDRLCDSDKNTQLWKGPLPGQDGVVRDLVFPCTGGYDSMDVSDLENKDRVERTLRGASERLEALILGAAYGWMNKPPFWTIQDAEETRKYQEDTKTATFNVTRFWPRSHEQLKECCAAGGRWRFREHLHTVFRQKCARSGRVLMENKYGEHNLALYPKVVLDPLKPAAFKRGEKTPIEYLHPSRTDEGQCLNEFQHHMNTDATIHGTIQRLNALVGGVAYECLEIPLPWNRILDERYIREEEGYDAGYEDEDEGKEEESEDEGWNSSQFICRGGSRDSRSSCSSWSSGSSEQSLRTPMDEERMEREQKRWAELVQSEL